MKCIENSRGPREKMITKFASAAILFFTLLFAANGSASGQSIYPEAAEKVRSKVHERLENGKKAVVVKKVDGTEIKGELVSADTDSFTVVEAGSGRNTVLLFKDVSKIKGQGWPTSGKIAVATGAAAGATLLILYAAFKHATRDN
jgi:small nuclear ribonucleoprotein (snRNP)-like protein